MRITRNLTNVILIIMMMLIIGCEDRIGDTYNPKILYTLYWDIYTINLDGTEEINLTPDSDYIYHGSPQFKPDGNNIIYSRQEDGQSQIYIMDIDGSNKTSLSKSSTNDYGPDISPDGQLITYISEMDSITNIFIMNMDGSNKIQLTNSDSRNISRPTFSPAGDKIYFFTYENKNNYYSMNLDGSDVTGINHERTIINPRFSPDGEKIVFSTWGESPNSEIWIMDQSGINEIRLTTIGHSERPRFSPDGSYIIYNYANNGLNIYRMDLNGENQVKVTDGIHCAYLPDGSQLIFQRFNYNGFSGAQLFIMNLENTETRLIASVEDWEFVSVQVQP